MGSHLGVETLMAVLPHLKNKEVEFGWMSHTAEVLGADCGSLKIPV